MPDYRRSFSPGGTFFFTVMLAEDCRITLTENIGLLRQVYAETLQQKPFRTDAIVVLPDHLHVVWTLPPGDSDYSERWRRLKGRFSRKIGMRMPITSSMRNKGERGIWQRRFWEHRIRDERDLRAHIEYCWYDPVRHGYCRRASDWATSSIHREIRLGVVPEEWNGPYQSPPTAIDTARVPLSSP